MVDLKNTFNRPDESILKLLIEVTNDKWIDPSGTNSHGMENHVNGRHEVLFTTGCRVDVDKEEGINTEEVDGGAQGEVGAKQSHEEGRCLLRSLVDFVSL
jgi:hypothetical protein